MADGRAGLDATAVRTALWRALHVQADPPPHVFEDEVGLKLVGDGEEWRRRPDMDLRGTARSRASIVGRARFVEDLVAEEAGKGIRQYVILGSGLDTFAERRVDAHSKMRVFEVDRPGMVEWKRQRLMELGYGVPEWLKFAPVDFVEGSWWDALVAAGFDDEQPAVVAAVGLSMYLSRNENEDSLYRLASLVTGSTTVMTFLLPLELVDVEERPAREQSEKSTRASGNPWVTYYAPSELERLAWDAGFADVHHLSSAMLAEKYFAGRTDGLRPSSAEELLLCRT